MLSPCFHRPVLKAQASGLGSNDPKCLLGNCSSPFYRQHPARLPVFFQPLTRSSLFLGPGLAAQQVSASFYLVTTRGVCFQHTGDVEADSFPTSSKEPRKGARTSLQGAYLPTQVPLPMYILFREEGLMSSFSGLHAPENWWLSWEGCYSKASQSCCTKKERQRLEKRNDRE